MTEINNRIFKTLLCAFPFKQQRSQIAKGFLFSEDKLFHVSDCPSIPLWAYPPLKTNFKITFHAILKTQ